MTQVKRVSRNTMNKLSGHPDNPGRAESSKNTIYLKKGLNPQEEATVLAHEYEHIAKGEDGNFWGAVVSAAGSLLGGAASNRAASDQSAINAQSTENASQRTMEMNRRAQEEYQRQYELARRDTLAGRTTGIGAMNFLNQALLPQGYGSYTDPNIAFTPEYLQPMQYSAEGEASVGQSGDFRPHSVLFGGDPSAALSRNLDYYKDRFNPSNIGGLLEPEDPLNFFGFQDTGTYTLPDYVPSEGTRLTDYTGGRNLRPSAGPPPAESGPLPNFMPSEFEPGEFRADPGYQFRLSEGEKGMQNQLSASGMNASGRALKEMERFRQGLGSQEYGNFFNRELSKHQQTNQDKQNYLSRIMQMAGFGPQSVNTVASAGANTASGAGSANINTGNALASIGMQGGANAANIAGQRGANWNNAIQGGLQNFTQWQQQQNMNNMFNQTDPRNTFYRGDVWGNPN